MEVLIRGKKYIFNNEVKNNKKYRDSFNRLCSKVFDIDFEKWYEKGNWTSNYIPYVLLDNEEVVANVSANIMNMMVDGEKKSYIQIGTVMTDPDYRKKGLADFLMNRVIEDYYENVDGIYLFANETVTNFYPRYGFKSFNEYEYYRFVNNYELFENKLRKLDLNDLDDRELFLSKYKEGNLYSAIDMLDNKGLLMFYCDNFFKDFIYYIEETDQVAVVEYDMNNLYCYDIFGYSQNSLSYILDNYLATVYTEKLILGFTPKEKDGFKMKILNDDDTTLFILKEDKIEDSKTMFSIMSRA